MWEIIQLSSFAIAILFRFYADSLELNLPRTTQCWIIATDSGTHAAANVHGLCNW